MSLLATLAAGVALAAQLSPAAPDPTELRAAVDTAERRGNNVDDIRKALDGFETALAKGIPGPELAALRAAVETAARKGEDVECVSEQLDLLERAVTGRAYERPRRPESLPPPASFLVVVRGDVSSVLNRQGTPFELRKDEPPEMKMKRLKSFVENWPKLTPAERENELNELVKMFPPKHEAQIRNYFRALAEAHDRKN